MPNDDGRTFVYLKLRDLTTLGPLRYPGEARKILPRPGVIGWEVKDKRGRWREIAPEEVVDVKLEIKT